jgi:hypothetical protein
MRMPPQSRTKTFPIGKKERTGLQSVNKNINESFTKATNSRKMTSV